MERRLLSVAIVTWNSALYLRRCLEGIHRQTLQPLQLIAVDNASHDESAELLAAAGARLIRNKTNRGFSAAVNQALEVASGEFFLVVNPDCFLSPDYAERLIHALNEAGPWFGAATGMLLRARGTDIEPTGEIDSVGIRMTRSGRHLDLGQGMRPAAMSTLDSSAFRPMGEGRYEVFGVSGAAACFRSAFLRAVAVGGQALDEDFFAYREDADLAWRSRIFGWRALCDTNAVACHVRRVTPEVRRRLPDQVNMHSVKNRFLLRIGNQGRHLMLVHAPWQLARDLVVIGAALTIERTSLPAFSWLWRERKRLFARRWEVQNRRVVSDEAIEGWFT